MKKQYLIFSIILSFCAFSASAQLRYVNPIYTNADVEVISNVKFATNIDFLTSKLTDPAKVGADITEIKTALAMSQPIPAKYFDPTDATSVLKVTDLKMDIYKAKASVDTKTDRPVIIFLHTGNFLPPPINGSPNGLKTDSSGIVLCQEWAKRGYVAVSIDYRLGWNPLAATAEERRGQLLNAVYRAIHDTKEAVRTLKTDAATYGIDSSRVVLYGEGTGAYIALAYETLDKNSEMELPKFSAGGVGPSYINRANVGEIDGSGGTFNLYASSTVSTKIKAVVAAGGALADTSWLEAGNVPMISFHCVRDPFAPFSQGTVIVPTTNEVVVEVQGANLYIQKANQLGNNDKIKNIAANDPYTIAAEGRYGATVDYIYDAPDDKITINTNVKGLFPVLLPVNSTILNNQSSPWQWWDPTSALATTVVGQFMGQPVTAHQNSLGSNSDMSPAKGRTYVDTIMGYMCPRVALINGSITLNQLSVSEVLAPGLAKVYPNPASSSVTIAVDAKYNVSSIRIFDVTGREVLSNLEGNNVTLNIEALQAGYYFVNVYTTAGVSSTKLIKE
jgi:hypothetical protein